jgi:tetratricopeptide (TPR) repeat protein
MGVVYTAYDPDLDRKVAIKLLRPGFDGRRPSVGTTRLLREAQALARLTHPNVVAIHDVGTHDGAVFLAMEFVDGETLGAWMAGEPCPWREVRRRFLAAGRGLAAAHAAGLVHRDFKPDNVLLGSDGRIRVADFGIARAGEEERTGSSPFGSDALETASKSTGPPANLTRTGAVVGTPAYMAPEQQFGVAVGPNADQFSFCVALWEALYGERPYAGDTMAEIAYQIREGIVRDPPRGIRVPAWLRRVALRGLRAQPDDRYPSMDALLADLARDRSATRRLGLLAVVTAISIGTTVGMLWYAEQDRVEACSGFDEAIAQTWGTDQQQRLMTAFQGTGLVYAEDSAIRVTNALDIYARAWSEHAEASCQATQHGEQSERLLDARTACLHRARTEIAALIDVLVRADEGTVDHAVEAVTAVAPPERCADTERLLAASPPPEDPDAAARVKQAEADLARAEALRATAQYKAAREVTEIIAREADEIGYLPLVARAHLLLATITTRLTDREATRAAVQNAFTAGLTSGEDELVARSAYHMLWVAADEEDAKAVEYWASLSGALVEKLDDDDLRNTLAANHATAYHGLGRLDEAQAKLEEALARAEASSGDSLRTAHLCLNLAAVVSDRGDYTRVAELSGRAHEIFRRELGEDNPLAATALNNLAIAAYQEGNDEAAEEAIRRVLEIRTRVFGERSEGHAATLYNLAAILAESGKVEEAIALFRQLVDTYGDLSGPQSVDVGETRASLASALEIAGRLDEAHEEIEQAMEILGTKLQPQDHRLATGLTIRASIARKQNALERSRIDLERAIAILERAVGPDGPRLSPPLVQLALTRLELGQPDEALTSIERAIALAEGQPLRSLARGELFFTHARALWDSGTDRARARARGHEALAAYSEIPEVEAEGIAAVERWLNTHGEL